MEKLPRAIPWPQIQQLLRSIDCSDPFGLRDFTMIYLAATYGLRRSGSGEADADDIDWRARTLRILQTKSGQVLKLPLTDEAANVLIRYFARSPRPAEPASALVSQTRGSVRPSGLLRVAQRACENRIKRSGLKIAIWRQSHATPFFGRSSLQQGVAVKTIGDTLGHKAIESTSTYLRLGVED